MSFQFITCRETKCPFNYNNECRSDFIEVGESGECLTFNNKDSKKADTTKHVNIKKCNCSECDYWVEDFQNYNESGKCELNSPLHFIISENQPKCRDFIKVPKEPSYTSKLG